MTYPFKDECQNVSIDVSSATIIFHDGEEALKGGFGSNLKPLVLWFISVKFSATW